MPRILIVDDSTTAVALFQVFLVGQDSELFVARDGAEALEIARSVRPDVILTDIEMPRMDGYELCAAIRRDPALRHVPVVLLTSHGDPASRRLGQQAGASAFLTKPASPGVVRSTVRELLRLGADASAMGA
ncbi:MAG TPA: response regulator [Anaeromyxobacteraceae bacterium]|nr:response regulator [Anaeromyxobacteraceae bacterium]